MLFSTTKTRPIEVKTWTARDFAIRLGCLPPVMLVGWEAFRAMSAEQAAFMDELNAALVREWQAREFRAELERLAYKCEDFRYLGLIAKELEHVRKMVG